MQVSRLHRQGAHRLLTSLQRVESVSGNFSVAASRLEIEEPARSRSTTNGKRNKSVNKKFESGKNPQNWSISVLKFSIYQDFRRISLTNFPNFRLTCFCFNNW